MSKYLELENVLDTFEFLLVSGLKIAVSNWQGLGRVEMCVGVEDRKQLAVSSGLPWVGRGFYGKCWMLVRNSPGGELLEALLVVRVVCVNVGTLDAGDAESSGLVETLDARCDLDTGLCGCANGAGGDAEEGHCVCECEDRGRRD